MSEKTRPSVPNRNLGHQAKDKMPKISPVVAKPLVFGNGPIVEAPGGNGLITGGLGGAKCPANSGSATSGFHSAAPSASVWVCALARPSASHYRNCSALPGP